MPDFVIRANIKRFEQLLAAETDPAKRKALQSLLAEEHEKLQRWLAEQQQKVAE